MIPMIENSHLYNLHEMQYASLTPFHMMANATKQLHSHPLNPLAYTRFGRSMAAASEVMERITDRYGKPEFGITETLVDKKKVAVNEEVVMESPFCRLLHFKKDLKKEQPQLLIVAPMSGHHATLLRGTVEAMLPFCDVYITDWLDARGIPHHHGAFGFDDYVEHVVEFIEYLGPEVHCMAVCQPSVPLFVATSYMAQIKSKHAPRSIILMGGPIDTREGPTKVNQMASEKPISWFESNVITRVPFNYPGFMRRVYPGFIQLSGFMQLNLERHIDAHVSLFKHLVVGDGDSANAHKKFYNEYLSVADLPAEFYLETIDRVFQRHLLPRGLMTYKGEKIVPSAITKTALLTVEGELDDISGIGQTKASHKLVTKLAPEKQHHHFQLGVGHYGIFNGRKFREQIVPVIVDFIEKNA